jgi:hypothetical protein
VSDKRWEFCETHEPATEQRRSELEASGGG